MCKTPLPKRNIQLPMKILQKLHQNYCQVASIRGCLPGRHLEKFQVAALSITFRPPQRLHLWRSGLWTVHGFWICCSKLQQLTASHVAKQGIQSIHASAEAIIISWIPPDAAESGHESAEVPNCQGGWLTLLFPKKISDIF